MGGSSRARGLGYGTLGGSPPGEASRAHTPEQGGQQQHRSWLRVGIASIAVVASFGLLSASRFTQSPSSSYGLGDQAGADNQALAGAAKADAPQVTGTPGASAAGSDEGEEGLSFVASNEYTRRGDVVGRGYPWLQVCDAMFIIMGSRIVSSWHAVTRKSPKKSACGTIRFLYVLQPRTVREDPALRQA